METLFDLPTPNPKHPAKYTDALLIAFVKMLQGCNRILDPFGGTGKVFLINHWYPHAEIQAIEIEPEWAKMHPKTKLGNALELPWKDNYFDGVCTSPTYGNAMAKNNHMEMWSKEWKTFTYKTSLKRDLHPDNSGKLQWGEKYRQFHIMAWQEASRVLSVGGTFVLNIKNHIRVRKEIYVTEWHIETLKSLGYELVERIDIECPAMRYGKSRELRINHESVIKFVLREKRQLTQRAADGAKAVTKSDKCKHGFVRAWCVECSPRR